MCDRQATTGHDSTGDAETFMNGLNYEALLAHRHFPRRIVDHPSAMVPCQANRQELLTAQLVIAGEGLQSPQSRAAPVDADHDAPVHR